MSKRHKAGRAALGLSCGSCFERLAGVFASRVASVPGPPPDSATGFRNQQQRNLLLFKQLRKKPAAKCSRLLTHIPVNQCVALLQKSKRKSDQAPKRTLRTSPGRSGALSSECIASSSVKTE